MSTGVQVPLAASVPGGQGQQHRAAAGGRRLVLFQLQEVLDPESRPRPAELGRDGTGGRVPAGRQRGRVHALHLVGDQRLLVLLGQLAEGGGDRPALLTAQRLLLGRDRLTQVDEPMRVAPAALLAGRQGPGEVPGGDDGVGGKGPCLKALAHRHDPRERLLYQILHDVPVTDAGADDPSQQRG
jgi:hypothetical protein